MSVSRTYGRRHSGGAAAAGDSSVAKPLASGGLVDLAHAAGASDVDGLPETAAHGLKAAPGRGRPSLGAGLRSAAAMREAGEVAAAVSELTSRLVRHVNGLHVSSGRRLRHARHGVIVHFAPVTRLACCPPVCSLAFRRRRSRTPPRRPSPALPAPSILPCTCMPA